MRLIGGMEIWSSQDTQTQLLSHEQEGYHNGEVLPLA